MIDALIMRDFRAFRGVHTMPIGKMTLLYGRNGVGKTTILDALTILLQSLGVDGLAPSRKTPLRFKGPIKDVGGRHWSAEPGVPCWIGCRIGSLQVVRSLAGDTDITLEGTLTLRDGDLDFEPGALRRSLQEQELLLRHMAVVFAGLDQSLSPSDVDKDHFYALLREQGVHLPNPTDMDCKTQNYWNLSNEAAADIALEAAKVAGQFGPLTCIQAAAGRPTAETVNLSSAIIGDHDLDISNDELDPRGPARRLYPALCALLTRIRIPDEGRMESLYSGDEIQSIRAACDADVATFEEAIEKHVKDLWCNPNSHDGALFPLSPSIVCSEHDERFRDICEQSMVLDPVHHPIPAVMTQDEAIRVCRMDRRSMGRIADMLSCTMGRDVSHMGFCAVEPLGDLSPRWYPHLMPHESDPVHPIDDGAASEAHSLFMRIDGTTINASGLGQGWQHILPLLGRVTCPGATLVQQPETHLHPSAQYHLPEAIARHLAHSRLPTGIEPLEWLNGLMDENLNSPVYHEFVVMETHSEYILRGALRVARHGHVSSKDIIIVMVSTTKDGPYIVHYPLAQDGGFDAPWPTDFFPDPRES